MTNKKNLLQYLRPIIGWLLSLSILVPISVVILNSFKTSIEASKFNLTLPQELIWQNYVEVLQHSNLIIAFFNSALTSVLPTMLNIILAAMAAFVISRNRTKVNKWLYFIFFFGLIAPVNYVPTVMMFKWLHISGTYTSMILLLAATGIPFAVFLFYGFIETVSREIDEAAIIDGCGSGNLFFRIIFPLLKPVTVTGFLLNFIGCWNDFRTPLYLLNSSKKWGMIMNMYGFFGERQADWNLVCAVIVLTILPILVMYVFGQKYIIAGMTAGSVKG